MEINSLWPLCPTATGWRSCLKNNKKENRLFGGNVFVTDWHCRCGVILYQDEKNGLRGRKKPCGRFPGYPKNITLKSCQIEIPIYSVLFRFGHVSAPWIVYRGIWYTFTGNDQRSALYRCRFSRKQPAEYRNVFQYRDPGTWTHHRRFFQTSDDKAVFAVR